jgi:hypothetical protein
VPALTFAAVVAACVARGPAAGFAHDAALYWNGALALAGGGDVVAEAHLGYRGVLTPLVHAPAALVVRVAGPGWGPWAVLVQNAVLLGVLGALVLPRVARLFAPARQRQVLVCGALTALLLGGFAPYPLMDLWAVALVLVGVVALGGGRRWGVAAGAGALAVAVDLRPASLLAAGAVGLVWLAWRWRQAGWAALGVAVALLPQVALGAARFGRPLPWPVDVGTVAGTQAGGAGFVVRYDTVLDGTVLGGAPGAGARQFSCDPAMAAALVGRQLSSTGEVVGALLGELPASAALVARKAAASLLWSGATPYADRPVARVTVIGLAVVVVVAVGLVALAWRARPAWARRSGGAPRPAHAAPGPEGPGRGGPGRAMVAAALLGTVASLLLSTPEARFAVLVVAVGVAGVAVALTGGPAGATCGAPAGDPVVPTTPRRPLIRAAVAPWALAAALAVAVVLVGADGLAHPAPPGPADAAACAAA